MRGWGPAPPPPRQAPPPRLTAAPAGATIRPMRFGRHIFLASIFVLIPLVALVVVGILVLVFGRATVDITFGVLILSFCVALLVGAVLLVDRKSTRLNSSHSQISYAV